MKKGVLEKINEVSNPMVPNNGGEGIRLGHYIKEPTIGEGFIIYTGSNKGLITSMVNEIIESNDKMVKFRTNNSIYKLSI